MDVSAYMKKNLELLERIAEGIETINQNGVFVNNGGHPEGAIPIFGLDGTVNQLVLQSNHEAVVVGDKAKVTPAKEEPEGKGKTTAQSAGAAETSGTTSETGASASVESDANTQSPKDTAAKKKRATVDEARKVLKSFAAIEGNDAAMEMLSSLGAPSVSALEEKSTDEDDLLQQLIDKCGGSK